MSDVPQHCDWDERLQDWIDGELDPARSRALDEHVAGCASCRTRMSSLQSLDAALCGHFSQALPAESFDRRVFERIAGNARTDRAAARARLEREWQAQKAALSHQWRNAWRSLALNVLAGAAVLIVLVKTLAPLPFVAGLAERAWLLLAQFAAVHPAITFLPVTAAVTAVALWLARSLASTGR